MYELFTFLYIDAVGFNIKDPTTHYIIDRLIFRDLLIGFHLFDSRTVGCGRYTNLPDIQEISIDFDIARRLRRSHCIPEKEYPTQQAAFEEKLEDELELLTAEAKIRGMDKGQFIQFCQHIFEEMEMVPE